MDDKRPSVLTPALGDPALEISGSDLFWEQHWKKFAWGLAALAVLIVLAGVWSLRAASVRNAAETLYSTSGDAEGWREVIKLYPGSVPAGNAQIRLSQLLRTGGDLEGAATALENLLSAQPRHPLAGMAVFTLGEIRQLQGKEEVALEAYRAVAVRQADSFATPLAMLAEARLMVGRGQTGEARALLESIPLRYPDTPAAMLAMAEVAGLTPVGAPGAPDSGSW
jgi:tetratricopeptide (TPR) repeat protein